jgi:predicted alpha-1,2-mannosidase
MIRNRFRPQASPFGSRPGRNRTAFLSCTLALALGWVGLAPALAAQSAADWASKVNPFIGTGTNSLNDVANTIPGASRPFGMLYWSPDRTDGNFYRYDGGATRGFSLTHISGAGCSAYGDIPILPILGRVIVSPSQRPPTYEGRYQPQDQSAEPGYYSVKLDSGIEVRLSVSVRSGIAEIRFPDVPVERSILIDLSRNHTRVFNSEVEVGKNRVSGWVTSGEFCGFENQYQLFFVMETDQPAEQTGTFNEMRIRSGGETERGSRSGGYLTFSPKVRQLRLRVGISYVSVANALLNLRTEIPSWDFEETRVAARASWDAALGTIQATGADDSQETIFYTALYHSLLHPSVFSDINGEYRGFDGNVHSRKDHVQYANFSGWDIYRSQVQLIAMLFPDVASDMAQSLRLDAEQGGGLPIWPVANDESSVMVGDPSDLMIANIYAFGGRNFDARGAFSAMLKGADDPRTHVRLYPQRPHLDEYLDKGYVAQRGDSASSAGAASVTLEYANADFAVSRLASALADDQDARRFLVRSTNWRKLLDNETGFIRPRDENGLYLRDFSIAKSDGFVEGNSAQYTWMVPYDLNGLITAMGGPAVANARLDEYFKQYGRWTGSGYTPHFFISNEPSFGDPWIYNWTGEPWRTQQVVRACLKDLFTNSIGGIPGNDDLGATSSWAVLAFLGIYPEIPGVGGFALNTPAFPTVTLKVGERELHILAPGPADRAYIERVSLDGHDLQSLWLDLDRLKEVSNLEFVLAAAPSHTKWQPPPSFEPMSSK